MSDDFRKNIQQFSESAPALTTVMRSLMGGGLPQLMEDPEYRGILAEKRQSLSGFSDPYMERLKASATTGISNKYQQSMRNLVSQQRQSGVRGGAAQAGQSRLANQFAQGMADRDRQMMQLQRAEKEKALTEYGDFYRKGQEIDIANLIKEKKGLMTGVMGLTSALQPKATA